jgi:hypothetical protein
MSKERLTAFFPFLLIDGIIIFAMVMMLHLDWVVNNVLYGYDLRFSLDWAVPYWTTMRIILVLCSLAVVAVTIAGYSSSKRAKMESDKTIFVCKSCGAAWAELDRIVRIRDELPKFKVLTSCPSCSKKHPAHIVTIKDDELKTLAED